MAIVTLDDITKIDVASAQYIQGTNDEMIAAEINGVIVHVPVNTSVTEYRAIQEWVALGNTIADAPTE